MIAAALTVNIFGGKRGLILKMATIDDKNIIYKLLTNNGVYPGDPQCSSIWSYLNDYGNYTQAIFYKESHNDIKISPHCRDVKLLWNRFTGLTDDGRTWIAAYQEKEKSDSQRI